MRIHGPTFDEMLHPEKIDSTLRTRARTAPYGDPPNLLNPDNDTRKDERNRVRRGVLPHGRIGVDAGLVVLLGRCFPTASRKVAGTDRLIRARRN